MLSRLNDARRYWLLTWTTYGTWLPGDERGSTVGFDETTGDFVRHDRPGEQYAPPSPKLAEESRIRLSGPPVRLHQSQAHPLLVQFQETAQYRQWTLLAAAVMATHCHLVTDAPAVTKSEDILGDYKSYGSRRLNRIGHRPISGTWWTESGSRRPLRTEAAILGAVGYTLDQELPILVWCNPELFSERRLVLPARLMPMGAPNQGVYTPRSGGGAAESPPERGA